MSTPEDCSLPHEPIEVFELVANVKKVVFTDHIKHRRFSYLLLGEVLRIERQTFGLFREMVLTLASAVAKIVFNIEQDIIVSEKTTCW